MTVTVSLPQGGYPVHIRRGLLRDTGDLLRPLGIRRWAVAADETVAALYGGAVLDSLRHAGLSAELLTFPAGERHRTPETWLALCRNLARRGFTRADGLLGMPLVQMPTTLLSQVDSAVGGKTAVDLPEGKNLLGAFYQPCLVLVDPDCLTTLPPRQMRSGAAEVIKYGLIRDAAILDDMETETPDWEAVIAHCLTIKAALVAADEHDTGVRRLLNFGHTLGHAIEAAGGYETFTHGEAVAAGMAAILRWQLRRGDGVQAAYGRLLALLERWGLAAGLPCDSDAVRRYLAWDKKCEGDTVHAVLLRELGDAYVEDVPLSELWEATP